MTLRRGWMVCCLLCLGCQINLPIPSFPGLIQGPALPVARGVSADDAEDRPLGNFEPHLAVQSEATKSHLSLAAAQLEKGDELAACAHLGKYLADHTDHFEVRVRFAEMLLHQGRVKEARSELTKAVSQAQESGDKSLRLRVQCHSLLMEIADAQDDEYGLRFHRGVGLYLLAVSRAKLPEPDGKLPVEGLLCRAAGELALARAENPEEARPCWYLHLVWSALGQEAPAVRWLWRAYAAAPFSHLTPSEQRGMSLAISSLPRSARTSVAALPR